MGIQERKTRHRQFLRQEILDAAREMFVRDGFEGLSIRKVAEKIEYSPTTIYYYFADKGQLLSEIVLETFVKLNQRMEVTTKQPRSNSLHCLQAGMRTYIDFALEHPSHYYATFIYMCPEDSPKTVYPEVHVQGMRAFDYLRQAIRRAMQDGFVSQGELELISQTAWGGLHGVCALLISVGKHFPFEEKEPLVENTIRMILLGLGAAPALVEEAMQSRSLSAAS